jgi:hypothetical protein
MLAFYWRLLLLMAMVKRLGELTCVALSNLRSEDARRKPCPCSESSVRLWRWLAVHPRQPAGKSQRHRQTLRRLPKSRSPRRRSRTCPWRAFMSLTERTQALAGWAKEWPPPAVAEAVEAAGAAGAAGAAVGAEAAVAVVAAAVGHGASAASARFAFRGLV